MNFPPKWTKDGNNKVWHLSQGKVLMLQNLPLTDQAAFKTENKF